MTLSVKYLPCKHEGLSSVPRTTCGKREAMLQSRPLPDLVRVRRYTQTNQLKRSWMAPEELHLLLPSVSHMSMHTWAPTHRHI